MGAHGGGAGGASRRLAGARSLNLRGLRPADQRGGGVRGRGDGRGALRLWSRRRRVWGDAGARAQQPPRRRPRRPRPRRRPRRELARRPSPRRRQGRRRAPAPRAVLGGRAAADRLCPRVGRRRRRRADVHRGGGVARAAPRGSSLDVARAACPRVRRRADAVEGGAVCRGPAERGGAARRPQVGLDARLKSFSFDAGGGEAPLDGGGGARRRRRMATLPARPRRLSDSPNLGSGIPETGPADVVAANGGANGDAATERRPLARALPMAGSLPASSCRHRRRRRRRRSARTRSSAAAPVALAAAPPPRRRRRRRAAAAAASAASAASAALVAALRTQVGRWRELAARPSYGAPRRRRRPVGAAAVGDGARRPRAARGGGRLPVQAGLVVGRPRRRRPRAPRARRRAPRLALCAAAAAAWALLVRRGAAGRTRAPAARCSSRCSRAPRSRWRRAPDGVAVKLG